MNHTLGTNEKVDLKAEATLTELIDNNKKILESRISETTIIKLINMLRGENKHAKYVKILRALVNCDNRAIAVN
jgi:hypothetical protein